MRRLVLCLLVLAAVPLPPAAGAAPRPYLQDRAGDANGLNSQRLRLPLPESSTPPASLARADILSVTLTTVYRGTGRARRPNGLQVTMRLAEAPADGVMYTWSTAWRGTCDGHRSTLTGYLVMDGALSTATATCESADGTSSNDVLHDAQVDAVARTVTWRTRPTMPRGSGVVSMSADTSVFIVGVYDEASADGSWTYGR